MKFKSMSDTLLTYIKDNGLHLHVRLHWKLNALSYDLSSSLTKGYDTLLSSFHLTFQWKDERSPSSPLVSRYDDHYLIHCTQLHDKYHLIQIENKANLKLHDAACELKRQVVLYTQCGWLASCFQPKTYQVTFRSPRLLPSNARNKTLK